MKIIKQIVVLAANQPGTLANICGTLSDARVNILGISVVDHLDHALIRLVVDDCTRALHLLGEAGLPVVESEVIRLSLEEGPGALEKIASAIGEAELNIHYIYASEPLAGGPSALILKTNDDTRALAALRKTIPAESVK